MGTGQVLQLALLKFLTLALKPVEDAPRLPCPIGRREWEVPKHFNNYPKEILSPVSNSLLESSALVQNGRRWSAKGTKTVFDYFLVKDHFC